MNYEFLYKLNIKGLRFLKIIYFKNQNILIASKLYKSENNIKKYILYKYLLTNDNQLINDSETLLDFYNIENDYLIDLYTSLWCRNINIENNNCYLLIDFNKNRDNIYFESNNYLLETNDFITFTLVKKYNINNILHLEYSNNLFMSKLEKGNDQWGKYLFEFKVNEQIIKPYFDKYINYNEDNGHLLHDIYFDNENEKYKIIFSLLNKKNEYTIYESNSSDFIHFNNTLPIKTPKTPPPKAIRLRPAKFPSKATNLPAAESRSITASSKPFNIAIAILKILFSSLPLNFCTKASLSPADILAMIMSAILSIWGLFSNLSLNSDAT